MKNFRTTLFLATALLGAFGLLSFRTVVDSTNDSTKLSCDSTEKSELVVFLNDSTETDSLAFSNALFLSLGDSTEVDSLVAAYSAAFAYCDTTATKKDDEESLYNLYVLKAFASDSTDVDSLSAV